MYYVIAVGGAVQVAVLVCKGEQAARKCRMSIIFIC
jgi:hypothetical protein